jgi:hypothetical protein
VHSHRSSGQRLFNVRQGRDEGLLRFLRRIDPEASKRLLDREEVEACDIANERLRVALRQAIESW